MRGFWRTVILDDVWRHRFISLITIDAIDDNDEKDHCVIDAIDKKYENEPWTLASLWWSASPKWPGMVLGCWEFVFLFYLYLYLNFIWNIWVLTVSSLPVSVHDAVWQCAPHPIIILISPNQQSTNCHPPRSAYCSSVNVEAEAPGFNLLNLSGNIFWHENL